MQQAWRAFLGTPESGHGVQIYLDVEELADSVAAYLAAGWQRDEPAVLVATPVHLDVFFERFRTLGWDPASLEDEGLLVTADAEQTLEAVLEDGSPSPQAFERVVGGLIDGAAGPERRAVRVFGEMVNLLRERDRLDAAIALEELWEDAAARHPFSLLCGYCLDVFDRTVQAQVLPAVCAHHSHVLPAQRYARFARSVDSALDEVLGAREAGRIYMLLGRQIQEERVPAAQLILMWVSSNMPILAERILESARTHYLAKVA
jgi:MEDS: MEthanogen/methylotroph, DcmR Sensory domain